MTATAPIAPIDYAPPRPKVPPRAHPFRGLRIERWTYAHALLAAGMATVGVVATLPAWQDINFLAWHESEYSHIFLVPVVVLWMVFARRQRIRHCKPIGTLLGVAVALAGWGLSTAGHYRGWQTVWHAGAVLVVLGCVLSVLGKHAMFRFFPAVAVLAFLIPVPPHYRLSIAQPLQTWTAEVSQMFLELMRVPVVRQGDILIVNGKQLEIAEACNGLRMVFALILVSFAFSYGLPLRTSVRVIILLASPVSAILCNVIRIVPNALVYAYWSSEAGRLFHDVAGWLMLPVSFVILLGVVRLLRWASIPVMKYSLAA
ncbi:MAG TPA: exosortase/archaeosortase family protein [Humisphaera sp.]